MAFHPSGKLVAYAEKGRIKLVNIRGDLMQQFDLEVTSALSIVFLPKGDEMLIGCTEKTLIRRQI